jgi:hypothetical protein
MWLPEPRSSVAPHFDGQRSLGNGGRQLCAVASVAKAERLKTMITVRLFIVFLPSALRACQRNLLDAISEHPAELDDGSIMKPGRLAVQAPTEFLLAV